MVKNIFVIIITLVWSFSIDEAYAQSDISLNANDGIEWLRDQRQYIARGDAILERDGLTLKADELIVYYDEPDDGDIKVVRIDANGNVFVIRDDVIASGAQAAYHLNDKVAVIIGDSLELKNKDIIVQANESLEFWDNRNVIVARGKAITRHTQGTLKADILSAFLKNNTDKERVLDRIEALGNILITNGNEVIRGNEGVYQIKQEIANICGDVKITRGANQINGQCANVNFKTGNSKIIGSKNQRIQGLIIPNQ